MVVDSRQTAIAVGRLQFNSEYEAQIRYMAVDYDQQQKGLGTLLLNALEQKAVDLGADRIVLDARECALRFYRNNGYEAAGPGPVLFDSISHIKLTKSCNR